MDYKRCANCKEIKSSDEFSEDTRYKNNLASYCKECAIIKARASQAKRAKKEIEKKEPASLEKCIDCRFSEVSKPLFKIKGSKKLDRSVYCSYYKKFLGFVTKNDTEINLDFCSK